HRPISICFVGKKLFLIFNKMFTISPCLRGLRFFVCNPSRLAVPAGLWPRLILLHCPYLALPIFPYSGYAAVKKSFHINIHYSFEAGQHNADSE
ncbi:hypothetical protein, partial [Aeromonas caviae]